MFADLANRLSPALDAVAVFTTCAELVAVDIRVAVRAGRPDVREHEAPVAVRTPNVLMQAAKGLSRLGAVLKLGDRPVGRPTRGGVAVLTGQIQRTVRTLRPVRRLLGAAKPESQQHRPAPS